MKMSRKRAQELSAAGSDYPCPYFGPRRTIMRFLVEGWPTSLEECGYLDDESEWCVEFLEIEPDWGIEKGHGGWQVSKGYSPSTIWKTQERAEACLKLMKEDWWDGP